MNILKNESHNEKRIKDIFHLNQFDRFYVNPQVNFEIEGFLVPQVIIEYGSQVNIFIKISWIKLGQSQLVKSYFYLKLIDHGLVKPLKIWKDVQTTSIEGSQQESTLNLLSLSQDLTHI